MSAKWTTDGEGKSDIDETPAQESNLLPYSEQKESAGVGGGRRPRRPRPGDGDVSNDAKGDDVERPPIKTMEGGWGLGTAESTASEAQAKLATSGLVTQDFKANAEGVGSGARAVRRNHFDEETEILVIPDLEDEGEEEDIVSKVAVAPKNTTRRVPSLRELDEDLKYSVPSAADGLDMSLLTKTLVPPEMVK